MCLVVHELSATRLWENACDVAGCYDLLITFQDCTLHFLILSKAPGSFSHNISRILAGYSKFNFNFHSVCVFQITSSIYFASEKVVTEEASGESWIGNMIVVWIIKANTSSPGDLLPVYRQTNCALWSVISISRHLYTARLQTYTLSGRTTARNIEYLGLVLIHFPAVMVTFLQFSGCWEDP